MPRLPSPCPHLTAAAAAPLRSLRLLLLRRSSGLASLRRDPGELPLCPSCPASSPRLLACLACAAVSCPAHPCPRPGHHLALDIDRAELFCRACRDQVYHPDLDAAVVLSLASAAPPPLDIARKRRRAGYRPWTPDPHQRALISTRSVTVDVSTSSIPLGLRGLNNLGNTCFMNSVLQALLHTPLLRNYFLGDRHNRGTCGSQVCLACDLDAMYSAVFSGERKPYSPAAFLYSWWQHASDLASYEQHYAHDFFITMLDGIHEKEQDQSKPQIPSCLQLRLRIRLV